MPLKLLLVTLLTLTPIRATMTETVYEFDVRTIDGDLVSLESYKGSVLLIVNTASKCGYTPQYEGLQKLYETYREDGLVVLGFPANNFAGQEPGTDEEIKEFCQVNYSISFPMFSKVSVKGNDIHPLFGYITGSADGEEMGAIRWNFEKFLVDREGRLVKRFRSRNEPMDNEIRQAVEYYLAKGS